MYVSVSVPVRAVTATGSPACVLYKRYQLRRITGQGSIVQVETLNKTERHSSWRNND